MRLKWLERRRPLSLVLVLALGGVVVATISTGKEFAPPAATPGATASTDTSNRQPRDPTNSWLSTDGIARAVTFRKSFGLRTDEAWIRLVATDPRAIANATTYSIPILDAEAAHIADRETVLMDLERFRMGHVASWGGYFFEGNFVVVMLIDPNGSVESELRGAVPPPLLVRAARWSFQELTDLSIRISDDPWLQARYHVLSAGADVEHNTVALEVSSADQAAPAEITRHFNLGDELTVTIDGTGGGNGGQPGG